MNDKRKNLVKTFCHMRDRCYKENYKDFPNWGGRGIKICDEWLNDVELFIKWSLENGYEKGLSIDRINNDGDYSPDNCRWITLKEQNQNRRSCKYYTIDGETKNLQQWCDAYGISRSVADKRIRLGWTIEEALKTPKKARNTNDIVNQKFGRLTVIEFLGQDSNRQSIFKCLCDCGNFVEIGRQKLVSGHTRSCGCLRKDSIKNSINDKGLNIHTKGD